MPPGATATATQVQFCAGIRLSNSADINNFFRARKGQSYIKWFNATLARKGSWLEVVRLADSPQNDIKFNDFWNKINLIFGGTINLIQFVALMSIVSNETRGDFTPITENIGGGRPGHPGLAYAFDKIIEPNFSKRSYNKTNGNRTAFQCFNDPSFIAAHSTRAGASTLARTTDSRWSGEAWPAGIPTVVNPGINGFLMEADFMKFRGRGLIQTTGRNSYLPLIEFVQGYSGTNVIMIGFKTNWTGKPPDRVAFESSNQDWDALFQNTELTIAAEAVHVHNRAAGNYLGLSTDPTILAGMGSGSLFKMGKSISGGTAYANTFRARAGEVIAAI